jgi:hypothetical protein
MTPLRRLLLAALAAALASAQSGPENSDHYCITYFGTIQGSVTLPAGPIPARNYNGTTACPLFWQFPAAPGATLVLCPAGTGDDYWAKPGDALAVSAALNLRGDESEVLSRPLDDVYLQNLLITNGSVAGPFTAGAQPAVLARDGARSTPAVPAWVINGTQAAEIYETPNQGVYFNCANLAPGQRYQYCGNFDDTHSGGCWSEYHFTWNMTQPLNFSIEFTSTSATMEISSANDYNSTGHNILASLHFQGSTAIPPVADTAFWSNSFVNATQYQQHANAFQLVPDQEGLPLFLNGTKSGEWYDTANQTYSARSGSGRISGGKQMLLLTILLHVATSCLLH